MTFCWALRFGESGRYYVLDEKEKQRDADLLADAYEGAEVVRVQINLSRKPRRRMAPKRQAVTEGQR